MNPNPPNVPYQYPQDTGSSCPYSNSGGGNCVCCQGNTSALPGIHSPSNYGGGQITLNHSQPIVLCPQ